MAEAQLNQLLALGPFKAIDTTSSGDSIAPGAGISGLSANPMRQPQALSAERGRTQFAQITTGTAGAAISTIVPYVPPTIPAYANEFVVGVKGNNRFVFNPAAMTQYALNFGLSPDNVAFDQAIQYGSTLYDNAGRQFSSLNPTNTYLWQYPKPPNTYTITTTGGTLAAATYYYAFTRANKDANGAFNQETSSLGSDTPYPFSFVSTGTQAGVINGTFAGANTDGSTFTTNVYRQSNAQSIWYLLTNLTTNVAYTDNTSDATLAGLANNTQLQPYRDPPPVNGSNLGAIEIHKERAWNFLVVQNASTLNQPQSQLWYSNLGRPSEFNSVNQVQLVGNSATQGVPTTYSGAYGDFPVGLKSFSSVLFCFKRRTTWVCLGDDPSSFIVRKAFEIGITSRRSLTVGMLANAPMMFWLSEEGVVMSDGSSLAYISDAIRSIIDGISAPDRAGAVGAFARFFYYLSFPNLNVTYMYHTLTGQWFGPLPYSTASAYSVPANPNTFLGQGALNEFTAVRPNTNYIDQWLTGGDLDLGLSQAVSWQGPISDSNEPHREKMYSFVSINAPVQPSKFATVTLTIDPGSVPAKSWVWTFDLGKGPVQTQPVPADFRGVQAQLTVSFNT